MNERLLSLNMMNSIISNNNKYIIGNENFVSPQIDLKIKGNLNWDKKCASLSIEFKLFFV